MRQFFVMFLITVILFSCTDKRRSRLSREFKDPPAYTKPWVYWYWIDENISKEGITRDLEAMARVGIGEALIGQVSPGGKRGKVKMLSPEWWEMVRHAVGEGQRTGVDIGFFNGPGWAQSGGPWIDAEHAMQYVTSREVHVKGPGLFRDSIPANNPHFRDIAIQAFPDTKRKFIGHQPSKLASQPFVKNLKYLMDGDTTSEFVFMEGSEKHVPLTIDIYYNRPVKVQTLELLPVRASFRVKIGIQVPDGENGLRTIRTFDFDRRRTTLSVGPMRFAPLTISLPATRSDHYRLVITDPGDQWKAGFKEITLLENVLLDHYAEKQLGKMYPEPLPPWGAYRWPELQEVKPGEAVNPESVIDLSARVDKNGILEWEIPDGEWIILRTGMVPTGMKNAPAPPSATGYECDKLNKATVRKHIDAYLGGFFKDMPEEKRKSLKHIVIDSYEAGSQNWSPVMKRSFIEHYGYDPTPWLPVFTGRIVKSRDLSNRFLWDVRRLTADLISENYVGELRKIAQEKGLKLWLENYGHWGYPGEFLQYGGHSDAIAGEFWFENSIWDLGPVECRAASSAAHIYGKNTVHAESFTAGFNFRQTPASMKVRGDWAFTQGINHTVLHVYIHQPYNSTKVPGVTAWFGMSFQRNNTWFEQSRTWIDYMRRCHYMLQQGKHVADVCYFIGEDAPKMTGIRDPELPPGYDYDYINADVIRHRLKVKDGLLVLPDGMSYRLMVLPPEKTMRPEVLCKIKELVAGGAVITGPPPHRSPSLAGYPDCDREVAALAKEMWGEKPETRERSYRQGKIYNGIPLDKVFSHMHIRPDVICADTAILWTHRRSDEADIYFLSNQNNKEIETQISFRVKGKAPELWYPDNGHMEKAQHYTPAGLHTKVNLTFPPHGSLFVVFRDAADKNVANPERLIHDQGITVNGPWQVQFPPDWDTPGYIFMDSLISWTDYPDEGIRYFSGTAVYRNKFVLAEDQVGRDHKLMLSLGSVETIAEITLNGQDLGVLWKPPYTVDISRVVKAGSNEIGIKITNTWWNRLIGDARYPDGFPGSGFHQPRTFTTHKAWKATDKLLPSGLTGPVKVDVFKKVD